MDKAFPSGGKDCGFKSHLGLHFYYEQERPVREYDCAVGRGEHGCSGEYFFHQSGLGTDPIVVLCVECGTDPFRFC